jgi:phenylacetate-CoA ligase
MPFIRYDTGDLGSLMRDPCGCGRGLARIAGIMGRTRDFIYTPDGREIHGAFFNHFEPFYRTPWIAAWRVRQDRLDHLEISIRPDGEPREADIAHMRELLARGLGADMKVDFVMNPDLSVTPAGKQKVIECLIEKPAHKAAETH